MSAPNILLVDDDETLGRVLRRVLTQQGYNVVEAGNLAGALRLARENPPHLALLDLRLPDGDGIELAKALAEQGARFPVILMTAYPLRLRDQPELASRFASVLTKPLNLQELRQSVESALNRVPDATPATTGAPPVQATPPPAMESKTPPPAPATRSRRWAVVIVCILALAALAAVPVIGIVRGHKGVVSPQAPEGDGRQLAAKPEDGDPDGLVLSPQVVKELGLTTVAVEPGAGTRPLQLSGTINYNPDYLQRVHALFGGEVISIAEVEENVRGTTERRKLSFGDRVHAGELLAVVWSKDLGQMKSALVDARVRLLFDEETLKRYEALYASGGTAEAVVRAQRAQVSLDRNAAATAERTLVVARVPAEEIQAVKDEAQKIFERRGAHDPEKEKDWPRVEVRAGIDGTIVEKNVVVRDVVDTSFDMFRIADLEKLAVWANAYEEDLSELNRLTLPYPWQVRLAADARASGRAGPGELLRSPFCEKIAPAIDPNQHTALLIGRVENLPPEVLHPGQMVSVTVEVPRPGSTVAVPVSALDEDGETSVVFVQPDPNQSYYSERRVAVVQRLSDVVLVSSRLDEAQRKRGLRELKPGDRVVTRQVYLLRGALQDLKEHVQRQGGQSPTPPR